MKTFLCSDVAVKEVIAWLEEYMSNRGETTRWEIYPISSGNCCIKIFEHKDIVMFALKWVNG